jgi:H+/Cl- antiporter ClcA
VLKLINLHTSRFSLIKVILLLSCLAILTGSLVALFLWLLHEATSLRLQHSWLLWLLPFAGIAIHYLYRFSGKSAEKGNNLIIDEIHSPGGGVPGRMLPLVLFSTIITHLFGGSAGREGTAVQMGGSLAGLCSKWFKLDEFTTRLMLITGVAAGFGAVFGTPVAAGVFALEVLAIGAMQYRFLVPALFAAIIADKVCTLWGIKHQLYQIIIAEEMHPVIFSDHLILLMKVAFAAVIFGLVSFLFSTSVGMVKTAFNVLIKKGWLSPFIGGVLIIILSYLIGTDYLGLGVESVTGQVSIVSAFQAGGADLLSWLWKLVFTVITLGSGFKGGEVTPLFYIGSTLGNSLAALLHAPAGLLAALGFIAVFSAASNTPIAGTLLGVELFGGEYVLFFAVACFIAYQFSGHSGIYLSQRIGSPKAIAGNYAASLTLKDEVERRRNKLKRTLLKYSRRRKQ